MALGLSFGNEDGQALAPLVPRGGSAFGPKRQRAGALHDASATVWPPRTSARSWSAVALYRFPSSFV
jgi:hypothetical protein